MALPTHILLTYGYLLLFAWVLVEQLGIPPSGHAGAAAPERSPPKATQFPLALLAGSSPR